MLDLARFSVGEELRLSGLSIEEIDLPVFVSAAATFAAEQHWLAPHYYQPESGRLMTSIHCLDPHETLSPGQNEGISVPGR